MEFKEALLKLRELESNQGNIISTLGKGKHCFSFKIQNDSFIITNSGNNIYVVKKESWDKVVNRYNELPSNLREKGTQYTATHWRDKNPNTVFSPYIAALFIELLKMGEIST
jgi:hypothetical protein